MTNSPGPIATASSSSSIKIECLGMVCPEPIVELAKAARLHPRGALLELVNDDPALLKDVQAWCASTGHLLAQWRLEGTVYTLFIQLAGP